MPLIWRGSALGPPRGRSCDAPVAGTRHSNDGDTSAKSIVLRLTSAVLGDRERAGMAAVAACGSRWLGLFMRTPVYTSRARARPKIAAGERAVEAHRSARSSTRLCAGVRLRGSDFHPITEETADPEGVFPDGSVFPAYVRGAGTFVRIPPVFNQPARGPFWQTAIILHESMPSSIRFQAVGPFTPRPPTQRSRSISLG